MTPNPSDREWTFWGRHDPLWAVAAWPGKQIGGASPWTKDALLALGASDFADIRRHWQHFGILRGTCVEIGCGAGRLTAQLLAEFDRVVALDISPDQIALAQRFHDAEADRLTFFTVTEPALPLSSGSCTGMFSSHVFQHLSHFEMIVEYLRESFRVLAPGGTVCIHIPVPGAHRRRHRPAWWRALSTAAVKLRRALGARRLVEYHVYQPARVFRVLEALGYADAELRVFELRSNGDAHSFFFARRP